MKPCTARWITTRELVRGCREVLDDLERTGSPVMIVRHGLPAGILLPVGEAARKARVREILSGVPRNAYIEQLDSAANRSSGVDLKLPADAAGEQGLSLADPGGAAERDEADVADVLAKVDLTATEEAVLQAAGEVPQGLDAFARRAGGLSPTEVALALSKLEMKHFVRRDRSGGLVLAPEGAAVVVALQARDRGRHDDNDGAA